MMKGGNDMTDSTYRTVSGDRWDAIAYKVMGSESHTSKLIEANKQHRNIFIFPAGIELTVPDIQSAVPVELPPWKRGAVSWT